MESSDWPGAAFRPRALITIWRSLSSSSGVRFTGAAGGAPAAAAGAGSGGVRDGGGAGGLLLVGRPEAAACNLKHLNVVGLETGVHGAEPGQVRGGDGQGARSRLGECGGSDGESGCYRESGEMEGTNHESLVASVRRDFGDG